MAKPLMDINQIKKILPHRYPLLMVDKVLEMNDNSITAVKNVTGNEAVFNGHFPDQPIFPGVLQIEALAQVGGICALSQDNAPKGITFFAGVDGVKWKRPIVPGDQMIMTVKITKMRGPLLVCQGTISIEDELACEVSELKLMIVPPKE